MTAVLETAREALLAQLEPAIQQYEEAKADLKVKKEIKDQLEAAVQALSPKRKAEKPCPRKEDVRKVCLSLVKDNPEIDRTNLEGLTKQTLSEELGFNLRGVGLRLDECLKSEEFEVAANGTVSLA